ncbi:MAG TPA: DapH/DapD/GlmU-related protein [Elusimicrobiales bacterium]|nr:DapH/DapD/GlmU-related protein [Elusimicrobiales bacterium]
MKAIKSQTGSAIRGALRRLLSHEKTGVSPLCRPRPEEPLPSRDRILEAMELMRRALFPGFFDAEQHNPENLEFLVSESLDRAEKILSEQIRLSYCFFCKNDKACAPSCGRRADEAALELIKRLPDVQELLISDVQAAYEGDPAAIHPAETVFCYPGITAITNQRVAHELYKMGIPLLPRIITEHAHSVTGIDIHPGAKIGRNFFIDHGTGVVIGETTTIGRSVKIYQGVTLGAKSFPLDKNGKPIKGIKRHPDVEDGVTIYAGATILGTVRVGKNATIGANVWVTSDVPPGAKMSGRSH